MIESCIQFWSSRPRSGSCAASHLVEGRVVVVPTAFVAPYIVKRQFPIPMAILNVFPKNSTRVRLRTRFVHLYIVKGMTLSSFRQPLPRPAEASEGGSPHT